MKWFLALTTESPHYRAYVRLLKVAILSAREKTSLEPFVLFEGNDPSLFAWLRAQSVVVVQRRSRFYRQLHRVSMKEGRRFREVGSGAFLRVELPQFAQDLGIRDERVLYTDVDVYFRSDPVAFLKETPCELFAAAPQTFWDRKTDMNTGVLLLNLSRLTPLQPAFWEYIEQHLERTLQVGFDQPLTREFFGSPDPQWNDLPLTFNWKPYWGENPEAVIVHFHGPKPALGRQYLQKKYPPRYERLFGRGFHQFAREWARYAHWTDRASLRLFHTFSTSGQTLPRYGPNPFSNAEFAGPVGKSLAP